MGMGPTIEALRLRGTWSNLSVLPELPRQVQAQQPSLESGREMDDVPKLAVHPAPSPYSVPIQRLSRDRGFGNP